MTAHRALLGAGGALLAVSLFLPWFDGVSGWEHWAWADVVFAVVAVVLVGAAVPGVRRARVRAALAVLCGLGIAVVLGHGFEPEGDTTRALRAGPYVALAGLALGAIGAVAASDRVERRVLR